MREIHITTPNIDEALREDLECRLTAPHGAHEVTIDVNDGWTVGRFCRGRRLIEAGSGRRNLDMLRAGRIT